MLKKLIILLCLTLSPTLIQAADNAGAFMEMGINARPAAMGMSYVSEATGCDGVYWNPAALSQSEKLSMRNMSTRAYETDYTSIMVASRLMGLHMGIGYIGAQVPGIKNTELDSQTHRYYNTGKNLDYKAAAYYGAIAMELNPVLALGLTTKFIQEEAAGYRAQGLGADLGILCSPENNIKLGLNIQNMIQPRMKWNTPSGNTEVVPSLIRAGMSLNLLENTLTLCYETDFKKTREATHHAGLEYRPLPIFPLRAGLDGTAVSMGMGLNLDALQLDLAWTNPSQSYLDDIYRFSLGMAL